MNPPCASSKYHCLLGVVKCHPLTKKGGNMTDGFAEKSGQLEGGKNGCVWGNVTLAGLN